MKIGLIARGEDRGLGHLTYDFSVGFGAERVLLIEMGELARGFVSHRDRFPGATLIEYQPDGTLDEQIVREWLDGLDVVYSAETFYDWRLPSWARHHGVKTVCHLMPELWRHGHEPLPQPDAWWAPTPWRLDNLPPATRVVPIPVSADCPGRDLADKQHTGPLRFVHVGGHRAAKDRAGTIGFMRALPHLEQPCSVRVITQDNRLPSSLRLPSHVEYRTTMGGERDRWDLYRGSDVLVSPRRYGGLSLPVLEAFGMGLGVLMSDCPPNRHWPIWPIKVESRPPMLTGAGWVPTFEADPWQIATAMDALADGDYLNAEQQAAHWSYRQSWKALRSFYEAEFKRVLDAD